MSRPRTPLTVALLVAVSALVACSSTTTGTGADSVAAPSTSAGAVSPSAPAGPSTPSHAVSRVGPETPSAPATSAAPATPSGAGAGPPAACQPACTPVAHYDLGGGATLRLLKGTSTAFGGSSVLELVVGGAPAKWIVHDGDTPQALTCDIAGSVRNCVAVDATGAHAAIGYALVYPGGSNLIVGGSVESDTASLHVTDIDGDNRLDVYGLQNTYEPDYADGKLYWQTWRRSNDGTGLESTGCGPVVAPPPPAAPTGFLTGACGS